MIQLSQNSKINISRDGNGNSFNIVFFGINWGMVRRMLGLSKVSIDIEISIIPLDSNRNYVSNVKGIESIVSKEDNKTIKIQLSDIDDNVEHIFFVLNSNQKIDEISCVSICIYIMVKKHSRNVKDIFAKYELKLDTIDLGNKKSIILGEIYREDRQWKFKAIGRVQ